jgi:hypothetical protein
VGQYPVHYNCRAVYAIPCAKLASTNIWQRLRTKGGRTGLITNRQQVWLHLGRTTPTNGFSEGGADMRSRWQQSSCSSKACTGRAEPNRSPIAQQMLWKASDLATRRQTPKLGSRPKRPRCLRRSQRFSKQCAHMGVALEDTLAHCIHHVHGGRHPIA